MVMGATVAGPFACLLVDHRDSSIHLVRDRFGFAPLFYRVIGQTLFCSNSLREIGALSPRPALDAIGLARYYLFRFVVPPLTLLQGVFQVPAGHSARFEQGSVEFHECSPFPVGNRNHRGHEGIADAVEAAVGESIAHATAPAVALSGGLDSAVIYASLPPREADAFALVSRDHRENLAAAESVCRGAGKCLQRIAFGAEDFRLLPEFVEALDEPVCVAPLFYLFLLLRGASGKADVMLLGEGGDELFLGYRHQIALVETFIRAGLSGTPASALRQSSMARRWRQVQDILRQSIHGEDLECVTDCLPHEPECAGINQFLDTLVCQEMTCFPYFYAGVRLGEWFGLDVRCPLLHPRVVAAAFSISWEAFLFPEARQGVTKLPLRQAFRQRLPPEILASPKRGFGEEWTGYRRFAGIQNEQACTAFARLREHGISAEPPSTSAGDEYQDFLWHNLFLGLWLDSMASS
jgi:asparagine synthetase B (glutamine-hydrolysing)